MASKGRDRLAQVRGLSCPGAWTDLPRCVERLGRGAIFTPTPRLKLGSPEKRTSARFVSVAREPSINLRKMDNNVCFLFKVDPLYISYPDSLLALLQHLYSHTTRSEPSVDWFDLGMDGTYLFLQMIPCPPFRSFRHLLDSEKRLGPS